MAPKKVQRSSGGASARYLHSAKPFNALPLGTLVLTLDGAIPVEYLGPGDRVITRDSGTARLRGFCAQTCCLGAVSITPGTLGHMRPDHKVTLPARQEILLRDWRASALFGAQQALVPISKLVDGTFIHGLGKIEMQLWELIFDVPHIIYADGLELASGASHHAMT